jgi:hypothetical protein
MQFLDVCLNSTLFLLKYNWFYLYKTVISYPSAGAGQVGYQLSVIRYPLSNAPGADEGG